MFEREMLFCFFGQICLHRASFVWYSENVENLFRFCQPSKSVFLLFFFFLKWVMIGNLQFWPMYQYHILEKIS